MSLGSNLGLLLATEKEYAAAASYSKQNTRKKTDIFSYGPAASYAPAGERH